MQKRFVFKHIMKIIVFISFLCVSPHRTFAADLTFYVQPYLPATELVKRFTPLARYLGDKLGSTIHIKILKNYESHIDLAGMDKADIVYMGPGPYVKMVEKYGKKPLLGRLNVRNIPAYHGMIIVQADSSFQSLSDLAGTNFAFGDLNSSMSYLVPRYMLQMAGVGLSDLGKYEFLGTHHDVALAVLGGYYDAGGVKEEVFFRYENRGLRMLAKSEPVSSHLLITRGGMNMALVHRIRKYLFDLNKDKRGLEILQSIKSSATGISSVKDEDYDTMRSYMTKGKDEIL